MGAARRVIAKAEWTKGKAKSALLVKLGWRKVDGLLISKKSTAPRRDGRTAARTCQIYLFADTPPRTPHQWRPTKRRSVVCFDGVQRSLNSLRRRDLSDAPISLTPPASPFAAKLFQEIGALVTISVAGIKIAEGVPGFP